MTSIASSRSGEELLESRMGSYRIERRVDPEPSRRQIERNVQQGLELVERLVGLAAHQVDPDQLELHVGTQEAVALHREQLDRPPAFAYRFLLLSEEGQRQPQQRVTLPVLGWGS
jgi:hypothetical protein